MRITRVYTRTGDEGQTRLAGGQQVQKDHRRIESYGTIDELNAVLGLARTFNARSEASPAQRDRLDEMLRRVQNDLFNAGAELATLPTDRWAGMVRILPEDTLRLEGWIDSLNEDLGPLTEFILPGGGPVGAFLHQARTVCRRAERELVGLLREDPHVDPEVLRYINRLSDWLFVAGRWAAKALGEPEYLWDRPPRAPRAD